MSTDDKDKEFDGIKYRVETRSPVLFRLFFAGLVVWAVCFMAYYLFSGWSSQGEFEQKKKGKQEALAKSGGVMPGGLVHKEGKKEEYIAMGKAEFAVRCALCHGAAAKGGIGPDLTRKELKYGKTEAILTESISKGRPGGMPAFGNELSHEKIEGLAQYILSLK
jgi:cytochrome c oxidase cbb3-type subunit 3